MVRAAAERREMGGKLPSDPAAEPVVNACALVPLMSVSRALGCDIHYRGRVMRLAAMRVAGGAAVLFGISSPAFASDWRLVDRSKTQNAYVDESSIGQNGTSRVIWEKFVNLHSDGTTGTYSVDHTRYDCAGLTFTVLSWTKYSADGSAVVASEQVQPMQLQSNDVVPDTVAERILNTVCSSAR